MTDLLVERPRPNWSERDVYDELAVVLRTERVAGAQRLALIVRACDERELRVEDLDGEPVLDALLGDDDPDWHADPDDADGWHGEERWLVMGADGTPPVAEFVTVELQALFGCHPNTMKARIADALNLRYRHPRLWDAVQDHQVEAWQALAVVGECIRAGLGGQEALQVDDWLADGIELLGWTRARRLLAGLIVRVDPALAAERAARKRGQRGVWTSPITDGQVHLEARLDGIDGLALEAQVARIARHLATDARNDGLEPDPLQLRRARALAMLAIPHLAAAYLEDHTTPGQPRAAVEDVLAPVPRIDPDKLRPPVKLYLHLHADDVTRPDPNGVIPHGSQVIRAEKHGPVDLASLHHVLRGSRVTVQPVIDLNTPPVTDRYEIPDRLREHVIARNPHDLIPWSGTESRSADLDHTIEYDWDDTDGTCQTRPDNLGPLSRLGHRAKTHGESTLEQMKPGVFWYTTQAGYQYLITPNGTMPMGRHPNRPQPDRTTEPKRARPPTPMREGPAQPPPPDPTHQDPTEPPPY